jgi:hypothetical protein
MAIHIDEVNGPFATRARAGEIALMEEFGLPEFIELRGVGVGDYSIYRVASGGISLRANECLADLSAAQQSAIFQAARSLTLGFPCKPAIFMKWYDATRGETKAGTQRPPNELGVSGLSISEGIAEELRRYAGSALQSAEPAVPSGDIVAAFRVETDKRAARA